jgi:predicted ATP-dependent endonuclease of OLD family
MKIKKFTAKNVHGVISFNIAFNADLTFLIGINGSGKTSALKLILGLISPSYLYLNLIDFETAELVCTSDNGKEIKITAKVSGEENGKLTLTYIDENKDKFEDKFEKIPYRYIENKIDEEINERFAPHIRKFEISNVVKQIRGIATPVFLGLDRRINEEREKFLDRRRGVFPPHQYSRMSQDDAINFSLRDIQELIFNYIRQLPFKQNRFTEEFKSKIFSTSFDFVESIEGLEKVDTNEIQLKKESVQKAIENLNIGDQ